MFLYSVRAYDLSDDKGSLVTIEVVISPPILQHKLYFSMVIQYFFFSDRMHVSNKERVSIHVGLENQEHEGRGKKNLALSYEEKILVLRCSHGVKVLVAGPE